MAATLLGILHVTACGGGDAFDDPGDATQESISDQCTKAYECMDAYPADFPVPFEFLFGTTTAECIEMLTPPPEVLQALRDAVDEGRTIYDTDAARQCNEALNAVACEDFWTSPSDPACDQIVMGTLPNGEACVIGAECVTLFCSGQGLCADQPSI